MRMARRRAYRRDTRERLLSVEPVDDRTERFATACGRQASSRA